MKFDVTDKSDARVILVDAERIDAAAALDFREGAAELAARAPSRVILDISRVRFIDSSGLGAIIGLMKLLSPDRRLELCEPMPSVRKVLRLTRIDEILKVHDRADPAPDRAVG
jgi:anti-sigma B factor antagonist